MKIATWNVNSLNTRLPQVIDWLADENADILCLQELKQTDDKVDVQTFRDIGYQIYFIGQKTYNGVAIVSKYELTKIQQNNPVYEDVQSRLIAATAESPVGPIRIVCVYCPNGASLDSDKYQYKLAWFEGLNQYIQTELQENERLVLTGDFNIAPESRDVHDKYSGEILISPPERKALQDLQDLGLHDAFRLFEQEEKSYSWWDYRRMGFRRNAGLRIDHILLSDALKDLCDSCIIDKGPRGNERPSDHAPVIAELKFNKA